MSSPAPVGYDVTTLEAPDFFGYMPSFWLAGVALTLYALGGCIVAAQTFYFKRARWTHLITATCLLEAAGYASVLYCAAQSGKSDIYGAYVASQVFIILAPNLLQAADYMVIGRVLVEAGISEGHRLLRPVVVSAIFSTCDVIGVTVQAVGTSIWASQLGSGVPDESKVKLGYIITLVGLGFQLASFAVFFALALWTRRHPRNALRGHPNFRKVFAMLFATMAGITLRNVYRFVAFMQQTIVDHPPPPGTYLLDDKQWAFYTFDTLPILLTVLVFILLHPSRLMSWGGALGAKDVEMGAATPAEPAHMVDVSLTKGDSVSSLSSAAAISAPAAAADAAC